MTPTSYHSLYDEAWPIPFIRPNTQVLPTRVAFFGRSPLPVFFESNLHCPDCIEDSLSERIVLGFQSADIGAHHCRVRVRRELAVGHVVAEHIKIAVAELRIALVIECCKRGSLVGFERYNGVVEHGPGFRCRAEDWALTDPTLDDSAATVRVAANILFFMAFSHL